MKTFKEIINESKKFILTPDTDDIEIVLRNLKRTLKAERSDQLEKVERGNKIVYTASVRAYQYFTSRDGEEDDDWPNFTGNKDVKKKIENALKLNKDIISDIDISGEEKGWISIIVEVDKGKFNKNPLEWQMMNNTEWKFGFPDANPPKGYSAPLYSTMKVENNIAEVTLERRGIEIYIEENERTFFIHKSDVLKIGAKLKRKMKVNELVSLGFEEMS